MAAGFLAALATLRGSLGGMPPVFTIARVAVATLAAALAAHLVPAHGKVLGLAALGLAAIVYVAVLIATGELGPDDRAKVARVLRRRGA
jgi:hypothetical protein